jgi:hypothetical protein
MKRIEAIGEFLNGAILKVMLAIGIIVLICFALIFTWIMLLGIYHVSIWLFDFIIGVFAILYEYTINLF